MLAFEHELAEGELGLTPDMQRVSAFLDLAAREPSPSLLVLDSKFLRKKRAFGFARGERFKTCRLSEVNRSDLLKACVSHGHLSVFFVPRNPHELLRQFEQMGFYRSGVRVSFGSGDEKDPLGNEGASVLRSFLESDAGRRTQAMFGFSHDATQFYQVYPWRTDARCPAQTVSQ